MKTNVVMEEVKRIFVKDFNAWFVLCDGIMRVIEKPQDYYIDVIDLSLELYLSQYKDKYPDIYLGDGLITRYNFNGYGDYIFFPEVEFSAEERCYIKEVEKVRCIISALSASQQLNQSKESKEKIKPVQKTYLMVDGNGYYKIGKSFNPKVRESTLQSENPTIKLVDSVCFDMEKELHLKYDSKRNRGEWFKLSKKDVSDIRKLWKNKNQPF